MHPELPCALEAMRRRATCRTPPKRTQDTYARVARPVGRRYGEPRIRRRANYGRDGSVGRLESGTSACQEIAVTEQPETPPPILVGFDGSEHGRDALALGGALAATLSTRLVVVIAYTPE